MGISTNSPRAVRQSCLFVVLGIAMVLLGTGSQASDSAGTDKHAGAESQTLTSQATTSGLSLNSDKQEPKTKHRIPWLGPQFGTFLPTSAKVRDRFGDSWTAIALGLGQVTQPSDHHAVVVDYSAIFNKSGDNYALIAPVGVAYQQFFGSNRKAHPYIGASADLVLASIRSDEDHVKSGLTVVPGGSVFTGISFGRRAFLEARYTAVSKVKDFDLSGTNITLGFRF